MQKIAVIFISLLLLFQGCGVAPPDTLTSQSQKASKSEQKISSPVIPPPQTKHEDLGYLPSPFTIQDRREIEKTIREYFDDLNRKDFGSAYDLRIIRGSSREEFVSNYRNMEIESAKIKSIQGYTISWPEGVKYVGDNVPTPYMSVVFEIKAKEPFPTMFFPSVKKDPAGNWKIYGLGTSP